MDLTSLAAAAAIMIPAEAPSSEGAALQLRPTPPPSAADFAQAPQSAEISVLTYNVKGLPWPIAFGRAAALRAIGRELAQMRREGRHPDVVLIQEGFRGEIADLVKASGYQYWAQGPKRSERASGPPVAAGRAWRPVHYRLHGEGWGKFAGSGLHVLSDLPITKVEGAVYRHCAGLDCLANKGVMLVSLSLPGGSAEVDVVNTHLNSKRKARVPMARTLKAHNLQTDELLTFIAEKQASSRPLLVGGDFNVKNAPDRYGYRASARPYKVVSEFCGDRAAGCQGQAPPAEAKPWLRSQDLQAFRSGRSAEVRPIRVDTLFGGAGTGRRLSDHEGHLVRYRISWSRPASGPQLAAGADPQTVALREAQPSGSIEHRLIAQRDD